MRAAGPTSPGVELEWNVPVALEPDAKVAVVCQITALSEAAVDLTLNLVLTDGQANLVVPSRFRALSGFSLFAIQSQIE